MVADAPHSCPVPGHPEEGSLVQGVAQYLEDSNKLSLVPGKAQRKRATDPFRGNRKFSNYSIIWHRHNANPVESQG